ncbi:MAG: oxidoreductase [Myxococcota bacterium]
MAGEAFGEHTVGNLEGKVCVITGANSGLGLETTRILASAGAHVVMACRTPSKAESALAGPLAKARERISVERLDLADLTSVRAFAERFRHDRLDVLINNAGIMAIPRSVTADGFEMQLGTNHLGHFALTGSLLGPLLATPQSRVVVVSSTLHRVGKIDFADIQGQRRYHPWRAYSQSKLANLLFTLELQKRLERAGAAVLSVAAHPGYAATNLQLVGPQLKRSRLWTGVMKLSNRVAAQPPAMGALPQVYAAVASDVANGAYYGPGGPFEMQGPPKRVGRSHAAANPDYALRLWDVSCELTGVGFDELGRPSSVYS